MSVTSADSADAPHRPADEVTVAGILVDWELVEHSRDVRSVAEIRHRIDALRNAGADVVVVATAGPPTTSGAVTLEAGVDALAARGITGALVLAVTPTAADDRQRPDIAEVTRVLDGQLARRRERRVPWIDEDPEWTIELPADPARTRVAESLGALANGHVGTRAAREEDGPGATPLFVASGVYTGDAVPELVRGPDWTAVPLNDVGPDRRILDMRTGVVVRSAAAGVRTLRFVSIAAPHALALRAEAPVGHLERPASPAGDPLRTWDDEAESPGGGSLAIAARDHWSDSARRCCVERLATWIADPAGAVTGRAAVRRLSELTDVGFDRLLADHRAAWARRWANAGVTIVGDPDAQLAARFAVFHLLSAAPDDGEAAVGPRGLTGAAYSGHVLWDADVFVLPVLAAIQPTGARAIVEYRVNRLARARANAAANNRAGARFPWESARDGFDVTPRHATDPSGTDVLIRTGDLEEHIVADVAWGLAEYVNWTGEASMLSGLGRDLVVDTARYWASRIELDTSGRGHIHGVIGPDEYHEGVDDNSFTNVMARWNLRLAAAVIDPADQALAAEAAQWLDVADRLVDGWDEARGLYEQFAGYWALEPLLAANVAPPPFPADLLLGAARVARSQLTKQPDVLMLHHLVPDEVRPGSLAGNLAFYEPRSTHGSSLSPAIHATLLARAGRPDEALQLFRLAARLDLDDITRTTASGLHLATMGGVWQALAYGFLGLRPHHDRLDIDPRLPAPWSSLRLSFRFHGHGVAVDASRDAIEISSTGPLVVDIAGRSHPCATGRTMVPLDTGRPGNEEMA
ncbi:glycoside hydrolase family 65 protein [Desertimonas flava]|uniref:glycoside hydrolase family 65 protein n=1 Tax=Desertimonas flava TaxID=2064846 RepID=UPI00196963DC|nr:glycoside hydrolase family 65 protein [Desertimonas flava]